MYFIWLALAVVCLVYYIACASYAGVGSSFIFVWLVGTLFFGLLFELRWASVRQIISVPEWFTRTVIALVIAGGTLFISVEGMIIAGMKQPVDEKCDYIIVLGCQVRGTRITKSLRKRLDTAIEYTKNQSDSVKIIVSGGQGNGEEISEAKAMYQYLVEHGIDKERIIREDKSTNTEENFRFSEQFIDDKEAKIGIVTNNFHVYRAKKLAYAKGFNNLIGIPAPSDNMLFINYMVRESIGVVKDYLFGNFKR